MILIFATTVCLALAVGCGTTRTSDTNRTATEQLLISDAIDRAVSELHLSSLAGQRVFLDDRYLADVVDRNYLVSSLRQQLLAYGCVLKTDSNEADYIVEARAGAVGTNRHDLLFGIPSTNLPQILPFQGVPAAIPEVPLAKRRDQRGLVKLAVFAYHRESGQPVWQSGIAQAESSLNDVWLLGAGPFEHGSLTKKREIVAAGNAPGEKTSVAAGNRRVPDPTQEALFAHPRQFVAATPPPAATEQAVQLAEHHAPLTETPEPHVLEPPNASALPLVPANQEAPDAAASPALGMREAVTPPPTRPGSFYTIERSALFTSQSQSNLPLPKDPVPLPQPIVDSVQ
jgi:hypothetical protein